MGEPESRPARVGVRELRQNLSVYLQRVKTGTSFEVTEHGHPVARLTPAPAPDRMPWQRLIDEGLVVPGSGDLGELGPPPPIELGPGPSVSQVLRRMRDEERW